MATVQTIKLGTTKTYYGGFLQSLLKEHNIDGYVVQEKNIISIVINDTDNNKLSAFFDSINKNLPFSLFFESIETTNTIPQIKELIVDKVDDRVCPKCLREILNSKNKEYLNIDYKCNHYGISQTYTDTKFDTLGSDYSYDYFDGSYLLICDTTKLDELFLLSQKEKTTLLSYEKPILKVSINDEELIQKVGKKFIDVKIFATAKESIIAYQNREKKYLFAKDKGEFRVFINQEKCHILNDNSFSTPLKPLDSDKTRNIILNTLDEFGITKGAVIFDLSSSGMYVYINKPDGLARVSTLSKGVSKTLIKDIQTYNGKKERLIENYKAKYPSVYEKLLAFDTNDLFDVLSIILELKPNETINEKSLEFIGNGGIKLDVKIGSDYAIDHIQLISSILSYRIADVEASIISYSFYESLVEMLQLIVDEANKKEKKELVFVGDMLQNQALYSKIIKKMSHLEPKISNRYTLA